MTRVFGSREALRIQRQLEERTRCSVCDPSTREPIPPGLGGSALSVHSCALLLSETLFASNSADIGGALDVQNAPAKAERCVFHNNTARMASGAVHALKSQASFQHCQFGGNSAAAVGAVFVDEGTVTFSHCNITNNSAGASVGGVYAVGDASFHDCDITNNTAINVGGIQVDGKAAFQNCRLENNRAGQIVGAVQVVGDARFRDCRIPNNRAEAERGGVSIKERATFHGCLFDGNIAGRNSPVAVVRGDVIFEDCSFTRNFAANDRVIEVTGNDTFRGRKGSATFKACRFVGNRVHNDEAVFFVKGRSLFSDCHMEDNVADHSNGVGRVMGEATFSNCTFANNAAGQSAQSEGQTRPGFVRQAVEGRCRLRGRSTPAIMASQDADSFPQIPSGRAVPSSSRSTIDGSWSSKTCAPKSIQAPIDCATTSSVP